MIQIGYMGTLPTLLWGFDGLQKVCRALVVNLLPMTHAEWYQLRGRLPFSMATRDQTAPTSQNPTKKTLSFGHLQKKLAFQKSLG